MIGFPALFTNLYSTLMNISENGRSIGRLTTAVRFSPPAKGQLPPPVKKLQPFVKSGGSSSGTRMPPRRPITSRVIVVVGVAVIEEFKIVSISIELNSFQIFLRLLKVTVNSTGCPLTIVQGCIEQPTTNSIVGVGSFGQASKFSDITTAGTSAARTKYFHILSVLYTSTTNAIQIET